MKYVIEAGQRQHEVEASSLTEAVVSVLRNHGAEATEDCEENGYEGWKRVTVAVLSGGYQEACVHCDKMFHLPIGDDVLYCSDECRLKDAEENEDKSGDEHTCAYCGDTGGPSGGPEMVEGDLLSSAGGWGWRCLDADECERHRDA